MIFIRESNVDPSCPKLPEPREATKSTFRQTVAAKSMILSWTTLLASSRSPPSRPKPAGPRAQGGKKGGFSIYLLRTKLLRDYVTKRLETRTKLLGD